MSKAEKDPITPDPVAEAGRRLRRLFDAINANSKDQMSARDGARCRLEEDGRHLDDALMIAEDEIGVARATSLAGAMTQALLAMADADCILSYVSDSHRDMAARYRRRIDRCLHSVVALLAEQGAIDPAEVAGEFCGGMAEDSPHRAIEKAVAA